MKIFYIFLIMVFFSGCSMLYKHSPLIDTEIHVSCKIYLECLRFNQKNNDKFSCQEMQIICREHLKKMK